MDGAVAFPEDEVGVVQVRVGVAAEVLARVPDDHLVERVAHRVGGVAAEVLVGEEEDLDLLGRTRGGALSLCRCAALQRPLQDVAAVAAGADRAAVLADEGFDRGASCSCR